MSKDKLVKTGRPSTYSPDVAEEICARVATGEDILSICSSEGMPSHTTLHRWREVRPEFRDAYTRARELSGEASEARIQKIMKDLRAGDIDANAARVLLDAEKWLAAKRAPRTHGDKIDVDHNIRGGGGMTVTVNVVPARVDPPAIEGELIQPALEA